MAAPSPAPFLLGPATIKGLEIKNRVVLAPLTRGRSTVSGVPTEIVVDYYKQRSNAGLIISEGASISPEGHGWAMCGQIWNDEHVEGWKKVIDTVHEEGSNIYIQLWHTGRASHSSLQPNNQMPVAPSAIAIVGDGVYGADFQKHPHEVPRALTEEDIQRTVQDYKNAAQKAKDAGADGVEVHSANGYLLDEFLQTHSNKRTDSYGGSLENRFRIVKEVLEAVCSVFPSNRVGIRLSPNGVFNDMGSEDNVESFLYFAEQLKQLNLSYVHIMDGLGFGFHKKCEPMNLTDFRLVFGKETPIMGNCGYTRDTAEGTIRSGAADLISFGRPFISNPDLVQRFENDWPLAEGNPATWFSHESEGYNDQPAYKAKEIPSGDAATPTA